MIFFTESLYKQHESSRVRLLKGLKEKCDLKGLDSSLLAPDLMSQQVKWHLKEL